MIDKLFFQEKTVLVTGACGTVGSQLVHQLIEEYEVGELVGLDNNESELFFLEQRYADCANANFSLADVRDRDKLVRKFKGVDIVFHAAAFKHVILCERSPFEAVQTNIIGVRNVIDAACECNVGRVIFTSSDKAVNPTNVMGTSKLMGERLITAANCNLREKRHGLRIHPFRERPRLQRFGHAGVPGADPVWRTGHPDRSGHDTLYHAR